MWLLTTDRAELRFFVSPDDVEGGYAILSHVWSKQEQSFSEVQKIHEDCLRTGDNPRDHVSEKIRQCCILAERHGYRWVWNDTCCIDKTSSAELSEAINSMFKYYSLAEVCYAYLQDVSFDCDMPGLGSAFRRSRWHQRGWTLQELVAPQFLVFLSDDWQILGTKTEFAGLLEEVTHIPARVLRSEESFSSISIAGRMSWASERQTTRVEDEAYCLMGMFGINMPTLYGEGREAFRRLQEEIMKQSIDTSLFAWGSRTSYIPPCSPAQPGDHVHKEDSYLLSRAASDFRLLDEPNAPAFTPPRRKMELHSKTNMLRPNILDILTGKSSDKAALRQVGIPTFSITPYGIHAHIPVFDVSGFTVAVLFCSDGKQTLGLFLTKCSDAADPFRPLYHVGMTSHNDDVIRMVTLGDQVDLLHLGEDPIKLEWKELYIAHRPLPGGEASSVSPLTMNGWISSPFHFAESNLRQLFRAWAFKLVQAKIPQMPWDGSSPATIVFEYTQARLIDFNAKQCGLVLRLGRCTARPSHSGSPPHLGPHWADVQFYFSNPPSPSDSHVCLADHICEWIDRKKAFKVPWDILGLDGPHTLESLMAFSHYDVIVAFSPFPLNPAEVLAVNISLRRVETADPSSDIHLFEHSLARAQMRLRDPASDMTMTGMEDMMNRPEDTSASGEHPIMPEAQSPGVCRCQ